jgi:pre-rRNA-processing protein TSR1
VKKDHKPFKSKHASKGALKNQHKGKVEKTTTGSTAVKVMSKIDRKNIANQLKKNKINDTKATRRVFEGSNGVNKIVTFISLTEDISPVDMVKQLLSNEMEDDLMIEYPTVSDVKINRFKSNLKVIVSNHENILQVLDATKVSDFVVFGISATEEVSKPGETILRAVLAQGIASVVGVLPNLASSYPKRNLQLDVRQSLLSFFQHFFPAEDKMYGLEIESERSNAVRLICQKFPKSINWRDSRGWLVADNVDYDNDTNSLVVSGTVRGTGFDSNRLIHIPNFGDFQVNKIEKLARNENVDYIPDSPESLEDLNPEEIDMADYDYQDQYDDDLGVRMDGRTYFDDGEEQQVRKFAVPKGTSDYQAQWLIDDVLENASDVEEEVHNDEQMDEDDAMDEDNHVHFDTATSYAPTEAGDDDMMVDLSPEEEERQLNEYRAAAKDDLEFPDEIELNPNESGKQRLSGYRGIKSVGTCNWDYDEYDVEAPSIWSRLLRISNFKATKNKLQKQIIANAQVTMGSKVKIYINAPQMVMESINIGAIPFTIYGLLEHEHKLAVVNWSFNTWEDYSEPVANKETLIVQYGPRRQVIQPLFNQGLNNGNNVHKSENFIHEHGSAIATAIAPVIFHNCPTIFFKQSPEGEVEFVGQGTLENCDHTRVVIQRAVLTGHPIKIHKRVVTVRYMFFNPTDIEFFKSIPLFTKSGRTGFIKQSLGTHGYFKANFDGKLTSQDTIAMSMYKRLWPECSEGYTGL